MPEAAASAQVLRIVEGEPRLVEDSWHLVDSAAEWEALLAEGAAAGGILVPLELALAHPQRLHEAPPARPYGVRLAPADEPARALPLFASIRLIGVDFPVFTDGRGYSTAVLLRTRLGWRGELRALGDVLQDQLYALRRVGFDSFALRAGRDPAAALRGFAVFSDSYQGSVDQPLPAFRRRAGQA
jgi:uncharacterized protein (DUF934 family)